MPQYYSDDFLREVSARNEIQNVVSDYLKLKKSGKYLMGLCPFHNEKTASFAVSPDKQLYYCFGCGAGGDVINFVMRIENLDFIEAVKFLAERAGINIPEENSKNYSSKYNFKQKIYKINIETAKFYYKNLFKKENKNALNYFYNRKLNNNTIKHFGLGYSEDKWDGLLNYLQKLGYTKEEILKAGLIVKKNKDIYYDRFRNRVIFPIIGIRGNIIGFGGRVLDDTLPKYLNSPETLVFNKRKNLFGLNIAKKSSQDYLIIVEGYMDVIMLHQCGINNVVASLGTALSEEQAKLISRYADKIIICYDSDAAGQNATLRGLDILNSIGCSIKVLTLNEAKDPDEFIKKYGKERFLISLREKSKTLIEYKSDLLSQKYNIDDIEQKIQFVKEISIELSKIRNSIERDAYVKKIAEESNISKEAIFSEIKKNMYKSTKKNYNNKKINAININNKSKENNMKKVDEIKVIESTILSAICYDRNNFKIISKVIKPNDFTTDVHKKLATIIYNYMENEDNIDPVNILTKFNKEDVDRVAYILHKDVIFDDNNKALNELIKRFKIAKKKVEINKLIKNGDIKAVNSLLRNIKN